MRAQLLVQWVNHHLRAFVEHNPSQTFVPAGYSISDLHADLADGVALAVLLHQATQACGHALAIADAALSHALMASDQSAH